jgi:hypothetical protein
MKIINCPPVGYRINSIAHIRSIEFREDCVYFDMALLRDRLTELRPWFTLNKATYLWILETGTKLPLIKYAGIPAVLHADTCNRGIIFQLYFPLPKNWATLDFVHIIEDENDSPNCINQYNICLTEKADRDLLHYWNVIKSKLEIPGL